MQKSGTAAEFLEAEKQGTYKGMGNKKIDKQVLFIVPAQKVTVKDEHGKRVEVFAMPVTPRQEPDTDADADELSA